MPDQVLRKVYDLREVRQDKRGSRMAVRPPDAADLWGVDGQTEGELRPFPGFIEVHQFNVSGWNSGVQTALGTGNTYHDRSSEIVDVFVRDILVGDEDYGYIIVHRVRRSQSATDGLTCDIFVDYWASVFGGSWMRSYVVKASVGLPPHLDPVDGVQIDVAVFGHLVYVFIEGSSPILFYLSKDSPYGAVRLATPGPGKMPLLESPANVAAIGDIVEAAEGHVGVGQVALTGYLPHETGLFADWNEYGTGTGTGTGAGDPDEDDITWLEPGDYGFSYMLVDSGTGRRSALSEIAWCRSSDFEIYSGGSGSGEYTNLYAVIEILYDTSKFDQAYVYRTLKLQDAGGTIVGNVPFLDQIIDLSDYHTVNNPGSIVTANYAQAVYWYTLEDKQLGLQQPYTDYATFDDGMPYGGAAIMYGGTMLVGKVRASGASSASAIRPNDLFRGATELRWSATTEISPELFPPANRYLPSLPANEIITFQRVGPNVIGFSRDRQYLIRQEGAYIKQPYEMLEGFGVTSQRAAESVGSLVYFGTTKGLKSVDVQGQMEDLSALNRVFVEDWQGDLDRVSMAYDANLSALFVLNPVQSEAYVLWFNTARVTGLRDMRWELCTRGPWPQDFVYDRDDLVNSSGSNNATYANPLVERAFFVANAPKDAGATVIPTWEFRLYMVDVERAKVRTDAGTGTASDTRYTMMPVEGDVVHTVSENYTSGDEIEVDISGARVVGDGTSTSAYNGVYLYVLNAADPSIIGEKALVERVSHTGGIGKFVLVEEASALVNKLVVGDIVGVSPVYMEWVGHPLSVEDEGGNVYSGFADFFRQRHIDTLSLVCSAVGGQSLSDAAGPVARFVGVVYEGTSATPKAVAQTRDRSNRVAVSLRQGESIVGANFGDHATTRGRHGVGGGSLSPGFRVFCPDLDYRVLAAKVIGRVRDSDASTVVDS